MGHAGMHIRPVFFFLTRSLYTGVPGLQGTDMLGMGYLMPR
jgi:hypothetical protein